MSSLLEPAASKFDTLPSIATLDGRPILSTGPQDSLDSMTEKRVDFALTLWSTAISASRSSETVREGVSKAFA